MRGQKSEARSQNSEGQKLELRPKFSGYGQSRPAVTLEWLADFFELQHQRSSLRDDL